MAVDQAANRKDQVGYRSRSFFLKCRSIGLKVSPALLFDILVYIFSHKIINSNQTIAEKPVSRAGRKADEKRGSLTQPNQPNPEQPSEAEGETGSWTLDNVTEVVYLATQLQMTQRLTEACQNAESGDKNALLVCHRISCQRN